MRLPYRFEGGGLCHTHSVPKDQAKHSRLKTLDLRWEV